MVRSYVVSGFSRTVRPPFSYNGAHRGATMRLLIATTLVLAATAMTSAQTKQIVRSGPDLGLPFSPAVKAGRPDLRVGYRRDGCGRQDRRRRHQGADAPDAEQYSAGAARGRLEPGQRRERHGLPDRRLGLRGDERGLPDLLAQGPAGADDDRGAARARGRANRDLDDRGARRRRAHGRPAGGLDQRRPTRTATASRPATRCFSPDSSAGTARTTRT